MNKHGESYDAVKEGGDGNIALSVITLTILNDPWHLFLTDSNVQRASILTTAAMLLLELLSPEFSSHCPRNMTVHCTLKN